jgi:hypothetical protein
VCRTSRKWRRKMQHQRVVEQHQHQHQHQGQEPRRIQHEQEDQPTSRVGLLH